MADRRWARVLALAALMVPSGVAGQETSGREPTVQPPDLATFGRLVAEHFDRLNGAPVEVSVDFHCWSGPCPPGAAAAFAEGFASVLDTEIVRDSDTARPACAWDEAGATAGGLRVQARRPEVEGDTARMEVRSSCGAGRRDGFMQMHEFRFARDGSGSWRFVSRKLVAIT